MLASARADFISFNRCMILSPLYMRIGDVDLVGAASSHGMIADLSFGGINSGLVESNRWMARDIMITMIGSFQLHVQRSQWARAGRLTARDDQNQATMRPLYAICFLGEHMMGVVER